jgi:hypothetical protein
VAAVAGPFRQVEGVVPFRPEVAAAHRNRAVVVVRQPTRHRVRAQQLCFCVVVRVQATVLVVRLAVAVLHFQQVRQGREV